MALDTIQSFNRNHIKVSTDEPVLLYDTSGNSSITSVLIMSLYIANVTKDSILASVYVTENAFDETAEKYYLLYRCPVPQGSTQQDVSKEKGVLLYRTNLQKDAVFVQIENAGSSTADLEADVTISVMENKTM